jgi:hypothetical protein
MLGLLSAFEPDCCWGWSIIVDANKCLILTHGVRSIMSTDWILNLNLVVPDNQSLDTRHVHCPVLSPVNAVSSCDDPLLANESSPTRDTLRQQALLDDRSLERSCGYYQRSSWYYQRLCGYYQRVMRILLKIVRILSKIMSISLWTTLFQF